MGAGTVADRLRSARLRRFVGRQAELGLLRGALEAEEPPFSVLYLHGPGGVGKTALLTMMTEVAAGCGVRAVRLDARTLEPSPAAFRAAFAAELGGVPADATGPERVMLMVDTFERAAALEGWLVDGFLPELPADTPVVIAGRRPPSRQWLDDPGWRELLRVVSLRNLPPADSVRLLRLSGLPPEADEGVLKVTHGHPLALSLLVDVWRQRGGAAVPTGLAEVPNVISTLLERFVSEVPGTRHRAALEICAHVRLTTEDLLRTALGDEDAGALFAWLRGLSFIEEGPRGVFPHDLARDVLDADLRWRDPEAYLAVHRRVRRPVIERISTTTGREQQQAIADLVFLHRASPLVRHFFHWAALGTVYADSLTPADRDPLLDMTRRHEGEESAALLAYWMDRLPRAFDVFHGPGGTPIGFAVMLPLHELTPADLDADPGARALWEYARTLARGDERVRGARFFMDRDAYQGPSPSFDMVSVRHTQLMMAHDHALDVIGAFTDPDAMEPLFAHLDFARVPEADYTVAGRRHGVFVHDWRRVGVAEWLEKLEDRETGAEPPPPAVAPSVVALSREDFADAVRGALRDLHRPERLARNPLLRSRLATDAAGLRKAIEEAAGTLRADPRDEKLFRALDRTYLRPAQTQERAAEVLNLPFSTYRRHLVRGIERLTELLWHRELHG